MSSNSYFKLNNTSAKNFGLNFQTSIKKEKKTLSYPVLSLHWCPVWYPVWYRSANMK